MNTIGATTAVGIKSDEQEAYNKKTMRESLLENREATLAELARIDTCLVSGSPLLEMTREQLQKFRVWF